MKNNKGQSLIDMIFSVAIVVLVLTGVVTLIVSTAGAKRTAFERQKAVELSQALIEAEVEKTKGDNALTFWTLPKNTISGSQDGYNYTVEYTCTISGSANDNCDITFNVTWGNNQSLSVKRFFTRRGI